MAATDFDFSLTRAEIINLAFEKIGVKPPGQNLSGSDAAKGALVLNNIVKAWRNKNIFLWKYQEVVISTVIGQEDYALPAGCISLESVRYVDSNGTNEVRTKIISYSDYLLIEDKTNTGRNPTHAAMNYSATAPTLYLYQVPTAVFNIKILYIERMKDLDLVSGVPEIPSELYRALIVDLAQELSDDYRLPLRERNYLEGKADRLIGEAKKRNIERVDNPVVVSAYPFTRRR